MKIYIPKQVVLTKSSCLPKLKSITVLLYDFSTVNATKDEFLLRTFSQVLATVLKY